MNSAADYDLREQFTIGVEEEYQLVSPTTGELTNMGADTRRADRTGEVSEEVQDTMVEIGTPVCVDTVELAARLRDRRFQASAAAASEDLEIVAAGTHPFSSWQSQTLSDGARPQLLARLFRQLLRQQSIWGMHVHVAVPPEMDRAVLMNTVRTYTPHLLALSCSSPFHLGADSGFASFRTVTWRGFPFVGPPPRFESAEEHQAFTELLLKSGVIPDGRTLYWSVRASPRYPTIELRICDACPRLAEAVGIAALGRAIVVAAATGALEPIGGSLSPSLQDEVLAENEWIAARDGLDAVLIGPESSDGRLPVASAIETLVGRVAPIAAQLGDAEALQTIPTIIANGNAADRIREQYARDQDMPALVDWLVQETRAGTGIARRTRVREESDSEPLTTPAP